MLSSGHAAGAIKSLEQNRALLKKKTYFKDSAFDPKWSQSKKLHFKKPTPLEIANNKIVNAAFIASERRKSTIGLVIGGLVVLALFIWFFINHQL